MMADQECSDVSVQHGRTEAACTHLVPCYPEGRAKEERSTQAAECLIWYHILQGRRGAEGICMGV